MPVCLSRGQKTCRSILRESRQVGKPARKTLSEQCTIQLVVAWEESFQADGKQRLRVGITLKLRVIPVIT